MLALLEGRDVLLVSPTGAGKSLTYQVPALLLEGPTVVVSPLLALQQDQRDALRAQLSHEQAVRISSAETPRQRTAALEALAAGEAEYVFLSPEQLALDDVRAAVARCGPSLVAVDEAHCVSAWGHDFRPDYLRLGQLVDAVAETAGARPRVIALTATAAEPVRDDIVERLHLHRPEVVVTGFERENLHLPVVRCADVVRQRDEVLEAAAGRSGAGIVYCRTRRSAEEYTGALRERGVDAATYHAGMPKRRRAELHQSFLAGDVDVVVATSAFGMGIDRADVRWVLHAQVPESPDTYYQEVGRAGRDGEPAAGILFYRPEDLSLGRFFAGAVPRREDVRAVVEAIGNGDAGVAGRERRRLREATGLGPRKLGRILNLLDELGPEVRADAPGEERVDAVVTQAEAHRKLERSRWRWSGGMPRRLGAARSTSWVTWVLHWTTCAGPVTTAVPALRRRLPRPRRASTGSPPRRMSGTTSSVTAR